MGFIKKLFNGVSKVIGGVGAVAGLAGLAGIGGLSATAGLLGAGSSLYGGFAEQKRAKKQAKLARWQASLDAQNSRRNTQRLAGQQRANFAAAGLKIEGSPALLIEETEQLGAEEVNNILYAGDQEAKAYKRAGRNALIGGTLGAGAGFLKGLS
ncbi:hypothetical protein O4H49_04425 [Kiloniella laminariae]|uniref:Uncharacterized protein n=1 Tax=Kiloniella laminariae TaxID=454162 RepID=A0ABT4LFY2_9PROT|nr:hypothetical protein [Kiloniella laminariae]MCZ4280011.1 hypothetical protein [Kiloniella laminariae]